MTRKEKLQRAVTELRPTILNFFSQPEHKLLFDESVTFTVRKSAKAAEGKVNIIATISVLAGPKNRYADLTKSQFQELLDPRSNEDARAAAEVSARPRKKRPRSN